MQCPGRLSRILVSLIEWLQEPRLEELRRSFTKWLLRVFLALSAFRLGETRDRAAERY